MNVAWFVAVGIVIAASGAPKAQGLERQRAEAILQTADEVMREVEELRSRPFLRPVKKAVKSREQLRAFLVHRLFEEGDAPQRLLQTEARLRLLGLLPPNADYRELSTEVLLSQIGGFYDPQDGAFYLLADATEHGVELSRMMLAHELCHALDDQYLGLDRILGERDGRRLTEDENFAAVSMVEGSATALMNAWMSKAVAEGRVGFRELEDANRRQMKRAKTLIESPRYFSLLVANYMVGLNFITKGKGQKDLFQGGLVKDTGQLIMKLRHRVPVSTEQVLHPEKFFPESAEEAPVVIANDDHIAERLADMTGNAVVERNTLGELICAVLADRMTRKLNLYQMVRPEYWTNEAATGWGGDRSYLLSSDPRGIEDPGLIWITLWDTEKDRVEFVRALRRFRGEALEFGFAERGRGAVFAFGSARALERGELLGLLGECRTEAFGDPWSVTR